MAISKHYCVASPYKGETLYSWLARISFLSGFPSDETFLQYFIGAKNHHLNSIFPSYFPELQVFSKIEARYLIDNHTALPYYRPFSVERLYQQAISELMSQKNNLGYSQFSLIGKPKPKEGQLFYCACCAVKDIESEGVAYWHIEHQLPWVEACFIHQCILSNVLALPNQLILPPQKVIKGEAVKAHPSQIQFALLSKSLWEFNLPALDIIRILKVYLSGFASKGLCNKGNSLNQSDLVEAVKEYWNGYIDSKLFALILNTNSLVHFPSCLLYDPKAQKSPVNHLIVIGMLFGTLDNFIWHYHRS